MSERELEKFYREHLEEDIIFCLSKRREISWEEAMNLYYASNLATCIYQGVYGVQYLDASVLTDMLEEELSLGDENCARRRANFIYANENDTNGNGALEYDIR